MFKFIRAYIKSMRLYYSFITGIAGWLGVSYYEFLEGPVASEKKFVILMLLFLSWGINQIINDYLGIKEDRINAPDRPMVTGELNSTYALILTGFLLLITGVITYFYLEPIALIYLFAGIVLNIIYEYAKAYGIWGNIVFGLMITMAPLYGGYAMGPTSESIFSTNKFSVLLMIWLLNGLMTFYTYFKDYKGDKIAGKNTIVVKYGIEISRILAIISAFYPAIFFITLRISGLHNYGLNTTFYILGGLTFCLQLWTGFLYYKNPEGIKSYDSLLTNFRACACGQATLIAIFNQDLAMWLFLFSYIFVGFLFELHGNSKA
ncbi:MAG: UbiA family prenyltransferase [Desulfobacterales bacterium]|nr:UbiA family prenyltransferase [Desulfobacterales bacterium]MCP4161853.1 UbiA family prenyltransferase [Deltaproteobacteria bacterium]